DLLCEGLQGPDVLVLGSLERKKIVVPMRRQDQLRKNQGAHQPSAYHKKLRLWQAGNGHDVDRALMPDDRRARFASVLGVVNDVIDVRVCEQDEVSALDVPIDRRRIRD